MTAHPYAPRLIAITLLLALPAAAGHTARSASSPSSHHASSQRCASCRRDRHGHIKRSRKAWSAFEHSHPCPSTGKTHGRCPGYVVDHVTPLECGGADAPSNMQWQSVAAGKAKDKIEAGCKR